MIKLKIKLVNPKASLPTLATEGSAGFDLHALIDEAITLAPGERVLVPTGISIELPSRDYVALICARSGLAIKHGVALSNGVGVIDSDYRGELGVGLINNGDKAYTIEPDERIAQLLVMPVCIPSIELSDSLS